MPFSKLYINRNFLRCKASNNKAEALLTHSYSEINASASSRLYFNVLHTYPHFSLQQTDPLLQVWNASTFIISAWHKRWDTWKGPYYRSDHLFPNISAAADYLKSLHSCHKTPTLAEGLLINSSPPGPLASITVASAQNS